MYAWPRHHTRLAPAVSTMSPTNCFICSNRQMSTDTVSLELHPLTQRLLVVDILAEQKTQAVHPSSWYQIGSFATFRFLQMQPGHTSPFPGARRHLSFYCFHSSFSSRMPQSSLGSILYVAFAYCPPWNSNTHLKSLHTSSYLATHSFNWSSFTHLVNFRQGLIV